MRLTMGERILWGVIASGIALSIFAPSCDPVPTYYDAPPTTWPYHDRSGAEAREDAEAWKDAKDTEYYDRLSEEGE